MTKYPVFKIIFVTDTVPYYEDFAEIKKKIWSMLDNAVKDRSSPFRIPVFICGDQSDLDGRIVVLRKFDTIGIDLLSAAANDIIVLGAKPLTFLDYIANDKLNPDVIEQIVTGMAKACKETGVSLVGGETECGG